MTCSANKYVRKCYFPIQWEYNFEYRVTQEPNHSWLRTPHDMYPLWNRLNINITALSIQIGDIILPSRISIKTSLHSWRHTLWQLSSLSTIILPIQMFFGNLGIKWNLWEKVFGLIHNAYCKGHLVYNFTWWNLIMIMSGNKDSVGAAWLQGRRY